MLNYCEQLTTVVYLVQNYCSPIRGHVNCYQCLFLFYLYCGKTNLIKLEGKKNLFISMIIVYKILEI